MKNEILYENINISDSPFVRNKKKNLTNNIFKKIESPIEFFNNNKNNKKSTLKINKNKKGIFKLTNPAIAHYNLNLLIDKMNSLKQLMCRTTDLKSMLVMDRYGLNYSRELRKNVNSSKRVMTSITPKNNLRKKFENSSKNNKIVNKSYFRTRTINPDTKIKKSSKERIRKLTKNGGTFDLSNTSKNIKEKKFNQTFLLNQKKDKTLYHLKARLFLLDRKNKITDNEEFDTGYKQNQNLTFIRENFDKENYYSQIKSKYMKNIHNIKNRRKHNITTVNNSHNKTKNISKISYNDNNIIKIKIDENSYTDTIEKIPSKNIIRNLKEKINSYKKKNNFRKRINKINNNTEKDLYILKTPSVKSPTLSLFNKSINLNKEKGKTLKVENKKSFTFITNSNNSQDNTSHNSLNSSIKTTDILNSLNKNNIKIIKKNYNKINTNKPKTRYQSSIDRIKKFKKVIFINSLNNLIKKSTKINNNFLFLNENGKLQKNKIFSKPDYSYQHESIDLDEINKFFKFSKAEEEEEDVDPEKILFENAKKVKTSMDKKCSKILDDIIRELLYHDRKLNKKYFGLSMYEKKLLKIKREETYKKLSNETVLFEKKFDKDQILNDFLPKEDELKKLVKEEKKDLIGEIDDLYNKYKILKFYNSG